MSQHDYILENQSGALFRQDLNNALKAIAENNMGATAPTTTYAGMWWLDTSTSPATLKIRNNTNSAWVSCGNLNEMSYLAGVTSGIQAQLNEKAALASPALTGTPTTPSAATGTKTTQIANTNFVAESKKVQYWSGTSRSYNTVYQASKSICVNVLLEGSFMNGAYLMTGMDTSTPTVIGQVGDDLNSNTKSASFWALIPAGMFWKVAPKGSYAFETIVIIEYPFGE